jgi:hypothetical protein
MILRNLFGNVVNEKTQDPNSPRFKVFLPGVVLLIVILLAIGSVTLTFIWRGQGRDIFSPHYLMQVYFFSPSDGQLYSEGRPWPHGNQLEWVRAAAGHLRFSPNNNRLSSTWPDINPLLGEEEIPFVMDFSIFERTLIAEFYDSYLEMPPLQEALFRSAFTLTMVGLPFIDEVIIRVNDNEWLESAATIANAPSMSPARQLLSSQLLILYFLDESGEGLVREYYNATDVDTQLVLRIALERLIEGPAEEGAVSSIPSETRILNIVPGIDPTSVYVNLSGEFLTRFTGSPDHARLMVASIVNTVLANSGDDIRQVFFLINSSREQFIGIDDFTRGFEYDETVMLDYVPEYSLIYDEDDNQ